MGIGNPKNAQMKITKSVGPRLAMSGASFASAPLPCYADFATQGELLIRLRFQSELILKDCPKRRNIRTRLGISAGSKGRI